MLPVFFLPPRPTDEAMEKAKEKYIKKWARDEEPPRIQQLVAAKGAKLQEQIARVKREAGATSCTIHVQKLYKSHATSFKLPANSYQLRATSTPATTGYKLQARGCQLHTPQATTCTLRVSRCARRRCKCGTPSR